ncbi:MAG TPA: lysophospholipid acyltransferase family protein [Kiritimatiellia bacterium]|nr:lysophospholipid acyltransferase family protein [Kiritimatiellia bacterium]
MRSRDVLIYKVVRGLAWCVARLPRGVAEGLGRGGGRLFHFFAGRKREMARRELARVFPDWPEERCRATAREVFEGVGLNGVELLQWYGGSRHDPMTRVVISEEGKAIFDRLHREGRGMLALVGHVGNFDLLAMWTAMRYPSAVIVKAIKNAGVNEVIRDLRMRSGLQLLPAKHAYRDALRCLRKGMFVGVIIDQNMTRDRGIFVEFLGRPACTTPGLAMMAAQSGAPVVPCFMLRRGGGHEVVVGEPMEPPESRSGEAIHAATQHYTRLLEEVVKAYPSQWIWMHNRWRTQPEASGEEG